MESCGVLFGCYKNWEAGGYWHSVAGAKDDGCPVMKEAVLNEELFHPKFVSVKKLFTIF